MDSTGVTQIDPQAVFQILFRYAVLILMYIITFITLIQGGSLQFIMFIVLFVLNVFGGLFMLRDTFIPNIGAINKVLYSQSQTGFSTDNSITLSLFLFALIVAILAQLFAIAITMSVFDYGKPSAYDLRTKPMSSRNENLMRELKKMLAGSTALTGLLGFFVVYQYIPDIYKPLLRNIVCTMISLAVLGIVGYELYLSVMFLRTRQRNAPLYV